MSKIHLCEMSQQVRLILLCFIIVLTLSGPLPFSACTSSANAEDREPLVALFNATGGPEWKDNSNWLSRRSLDLWHGIETASDGSGRVIDVALSDNQLTGQLPSELASLTHLRTLGLLNNQLSGELPPELAKLTNLEGLYLQDNQFRGAITPELGSMASLEGLGLSRNQLSGEIPGELGVTVQED